MSLERLKTIPRIPRKSFHQSIFSPLSSYRVVVEVTAFNPITCC